MVRQDLRPGVAVDGRTLRAKLVEVLVAHSTTPPSARLVIDHLLQAERMGVVTHGLVKLPTYVRATASGEVDPRAQPVVGVDAGARVVIDGRRAFGQVAAAYAVDIVSERAASHGIAVAAARRIGHAGRIGAYVEQLAGRGLIGLAFCSLPPHQHGVVWHRSTSGTLGTNPMAYAFPTDRDTVSADFSTSASSWGRIRQAFVDGESVPPGLIVDANGVETTNPAAYFGEPPGHLLPLGGQTGGHKGSALAMMVEMLATSLSGESPADQRSNNLTIIAIQPGSDFLGAAGDLVEHVRSAEPIDPKNPVRVPGDGSRTRAARRGPLRVAATTWDDLVRTAHESGVSLAAACRSA